MPAKTGARCAKAAVPQAATVTHLSSGRSAKELVDSHFRLSLDSHFRLSLQPQAAAPAVGRPAEEPPANQRLASAASCQGSARVLTVLHGSAEDLIDAHFRLSLGRKWPLLAHGDRRRPPAGRKLRAASSAVAKRPVSASKTSAASPTSATAPTAAAGKRPAVAKDAGAAARKRLAR